MRISTSVLKVQMITPTVRLIRLSIPKNFTFIAGQFITLILVHADGKEVRRAYSIASEPSLCKKGFMEICVKKVKGGVQSSRLHELEVGEKATIIGPLGQFIADERSLSTELVFVATGTG